MTIICHVGIVTYMASRVFGVRGLDDSLQDGIRRLAAQDKVPLHVLVGEAIAELLAKRGVKHALGDGLPPRLRAGRPRRQAWNDEELVVIDDDAA